MSATLAPDVQLSFAPLPKTCQVCAGWGVLEATDIFCGAGGSSLGLEAVCCPACGRSLIQVTQALNHNPLAVVAHNHNFPFADHDVHDVQDIPPSRFRRTPLLWASPDCTHHAYCRGPKAETPEADRSRATFRDVVRFTEYHRYDAIIVENVIEARLWCGVTGHPRKCSCGTAFDAWYRAMVELGYDGQIVYFNSQFALPTPQSRDRMYVVFWRHGLVAPPLDFRPASWCSQCVQVVNGVQTWKPTRKGTLRTQPGMFEWGRYGAQYVYRCPVCVTVVAPAVTGARRILDWTLPMHRIGDKPKAEKTNERIIHGVVRLATLEPVTVQVGGNLYERRPGVRVWSVDDPLRTVTGTQQLALVVQARRTQQNGTTAYGVDEPTTTGTAELGLVAAMRQGAVGGSVGEPVSALTGNAQQALIVRYGGQGGLGRGIGEAMHTVTAHDREIGLVIQNMENNVGRVLDEPGPPVTSGGNHMLVQVNRSSKRNGKVVNVDRNVSTLEEPTRTIAGHGELALVAFRNHGDARPLDEPAHALAAGGNHHGLLVYHATGAVSRDLNEPAGTVTARDKQSLLVPYYRTGVARSLGEPTGALTGRDREALITATTAELDNYLFRMLQWHELLRAQAPHDHHDGRPYELTARSKNRFGRMVELSNEKRVEYIGDMVSAPVATMLGAAVVETLVRAA